MKKEEGGCGEDIENDSKPGSDKGIKRNANGKVNSK